MTNKYLLYIDILGFAELVKEQPNKVERIYRIIDTLNVHKHSSFKVLAFSDTILVYNIPDPVTHRDHQYLVMYSIEFAQDLQLRLTGLDIFFRAVLSYGEFKHYELINLQCFYGQALVDAYHREKYICGVGLFIDNHSNNLNLVFTVNKYNVDLSFVYLTQNLQSLYNDTQGFLPVDMALIASSYPDILFEIQYLKDIFQQMRSNPDPKVRLKHAVTWDLFRGRYSRIIDSLEYSQFDPCILNNDYNWAGQKAALEESINYNKSI